MLVVFTYGRKLTFTFVRTFLSLLAESVKSFRPVSLHESKLDEKGLVNDRRFMLISPLPLPIYKDSFKPNEATHRFLSQRQCPILATVVAKLQDDKLTLTSEKLPGKSVTVLVQPKATATRYLTSLWDDTVQVVDMGDEMAEFCQALVNLDEEMPEESKPGVRLVTQSPTDQRITNEIYTPASALSWWGSRPSVSLTDGFPILLANQASLDELNRRLVAKGKPAIDMSRFRPNIVVQGAPAFDEDYWKVIAIDGVLFHIVKGCPRCKQSCTDQMTGQVHKEPLETLAEFRATSVHPENLYFAQNVIAATGSEGKMIRVGARVKVLQRGSPVWDR